ncbi:SDR family NAD(P)-dependent oxidoreductase [Streptomonospora sediminis]
MLPTYAFQHQHYWLEPAAQPTDAGALGQKPADHPLIGAAVELPEQGGAVLTGRMSVSVQPWLADHAVGETVVFPGTGFVELAVRAGDEVGCSVVEELTLEAPLVVEGGAAVVLQVTAGAADDTGRRSVAVHSRTGTRGWTRHATGVLAAEDTGDAAASFDLAQWPPAGARPVDAEGHYGRLAAAGYGYGPAFQGLKRAWMRGGEVFAEVELAEREAAQAGRFGIHPALLDSALHTLGLAAGIADGTGAEGGGVELPFAWSGVELLASGATHIRVHAAPNSDGGGHTFRLADTAGQPVALIRDLVTRPVPAGGLAPAAEGAGQDGLHHLHWVSPPGWDPAPAEGTWAVVGGAAGDGGAELSDGLRWSSAEVQDVPDLATAADVPDLGTVLVPFPLLPLPTSGRPGADGGAAATDDLRRSLDQALDVIRTWLQDDRFSRTRLVLATQGAVAARSADAAPDPAAAAVLGLARSAQAENPDRIVLVDLDGSQRSAQSLRTAAAGTDEPQVAVRGGEVLVPRLVRAEAAAELAVPAGAGSWRLDTTEAGSIGNLALVPAPEADRELAPGEVRVAVRAAGLNFRDVVVVLGMVPEQGGAIGGEFAGVVTETGPGVTRFEAGDHIMGMGEGAFGPGLVVDGRTAAPMPQGWTHADAASVPGAFCTAYYGLRDLADLRAGERVLVHSGAGGVGMAAVQIARYAGAEVFATASPGKWDRLRELGVAEDHIASSRDLGFAEAFRTLVGDAGMDVVLNSLAGEFTDASLDLLGTGGRFIEMGKTDRRDPAAVAETHPDVVYRSFDLMDAGPERIGAMLGELLSLFSAGALAGLPVRCWDVRRAPEAFRHMAQAKHTGKLVLTMPREPDPDGTVLVTGGTGGLGAVLARHLVAERGAHRLLLASRRGPDAPGAAELREELERAGAVVDIAACDLGDPAEVEALIAAVPAGHPLTVVFHTAGVLDDGVVSSLDTAKVDRVLRPKADAAWHLHEATRHLDLAAFVLYSSSAGTLDSAGQGNYSAANAFLDALAAYRCEQGLPALSLAWGLWEQPSGMSAHLTDADVARIERSGYRRITVAEGERLLEAALAGARPYVLPLPLDTRALAAAGTGLPAPLRGLVRSAGGRRSAQAGPAAGGASTLEQRLAAVPEAERVGELTTVVRECAAKVIGHAGPEAVRGEQNFLEAGFDSLTAMELRNVLNRATGLRMPATAVFDRGSPAELARFIADEMAFDAGQGAAGVSAAPAAPAGAAGGAGADGGSLSTLLRNAAPAGKIQEGLAMLESAAKLRPSFGSLEELDRPWPPLALATGPARPRLFCFSTPMALGGAAQFARLAARFQGKRDLYALQVPGYAPDDSLPETAEVITRMWAESIVEAAAGEPFVMLGYCGGGNFAHAAVSYLEARGVYPAGLILLDTFLPGSAVIDDLGGQMLAGMFERAETYGPFSDTRMTAMGRYYRLFRETAVEEIATPVLFLHPDTPLPDSGGERVKEGDWRATWHLDHELREVRGDHLTMLEEESAHMARVVEAWLARSEGVEGS